MNSPVRFPIRLKIMVVLLFTVTVTVSFITFSMARSFHADKQAYVNDWVSIAAVTTAEDCNTLLVSYARRLQSYARILLNPKLPREDKAAMMRGFFRDLPELVDITLYADGEVIDTASDRLGLQQAGLALSDLVAFRDEQPLPFERILDGEVYVRNSTISENLPWFTLAFTGDLEEDGPPVVVSAVLRLDELMRLGSQFKVFEVLLVDGDGVLLTHPEEIRVARRDPAGLPSLAQAVHQTHEVGRTVEFVREGTEMLGGFAGVTFGELTVAVHIPKSAAYLASQDLLKRLLWLALVLLVLCALAGRLWASRVTRPVERLSEATRTIARGDFGIQVDVESRDEIGALAGSFNQMASELKTREEALDQAQSQLVQSEKMAAFGQLGAGIAHEVKNPLAGILGCAQLSLMEVEEGSMTELNLKLIERETERCKTIIENLLKFARQERSILEPTEINRVVQDAVSIVNHQLEMHEVAMERKLADGLPLVQANANQLQQVLMNLMINAQQAMQGQPGTVTVETRQPDTGEVEIVVRDTGPGMPEEVRAKIFEPFFTTKPTGQGTGLGLSVSFGIVRDHDGEIRVHSEPGNGAEFVIGLPAMQKTVVRAEAPEDAVGTAVMAD